VGFFLKEKEKGVVFGLKLRNLVHVGVSALLSQPTQSPPFLMTHLAALQFELNPALVLTCYQCVWLPEREELGVRISLILLVRDREVDIYPFTFT
jgi:hypothetical protein